MNRAIKTALQRTRRGAMDDEDRSYANQQKVIRRRKRHLNEDQEQRQQRLEHEAALQRIRRERTFEDQCDSQGVMYCSPQSCNELVSSKRKRRKIIRKKFTTTSMKKSQSTASHRVNGNSYTCRHKDSSTPCDCNQPPAKTMFAVMGRDGTQKFASSSTSSAMYCNNKNIEPPKRTCYWNRYKQPYVKHEFSLRLDNTQDGCPVDDVMDAEIWINELYAFDVGQCTHALQQSTVVI